jgi:hypothetical protein
MSTSSTTSKIDKQKFFALVEDYGWGTKTTDYTAIKKDLMSKITPEVSGEIRSIFYGLCGKLHRTIEAWEEDNDKKISLGDDGFSDLVSHIVGLGSKEYEAVLADPKLAYDRAKRGDFSESFSYAIPSDWENVANSKEATMDRKYVALCGNLSEGFIVRGPYGSFDDAADAHTDQECWIMEMKPPASSKFADQEPVKDTCWSCGNKHLRDGIDAGCHVCANTADSFHAGVGGKP